MAALHGPKTCEMMVGLFTTFRFGKMPVPLKKKMQEKKKHFSMEKEGKKRKMSGVYKFLKN